MKLCKPVVKIDSELLLQTCNHDFDLYTSFKTLILSREYSKFLREFQKSNNVVTLECKWTKDKLTNGHGGTIMMKERKKQLINNKLLQESR